MRLRDTEQRRLAALERRFRPRPPDRAEIELLPRWLTFAEIETGQRALEAFGDDPLAALAAEDPVMVALVAAARARRQGVAIAPLFGEAP